MLGSVGVITERQLENGYQDGMLSLKSWESCSVSEEFRSGGSEGFLSVSEHIWWRGID